MNYVTLSELGAYFQADTTDPDVASWLTLHATNAEALINSYCDTSYVSTGATDVVRVFSAEGRSMVFMNPLLRSFSKVEIIDPETGNAISDITTKVTMYPKAGYLSTTLGLHKTLIYKDNVSLFPEGYENIRVTGQFGASVIPALLKQATLWTTKYLIDKTLVDENVLIDKSVDRALHFKKETKELPSTVCSMLKPFKVYRSFEDA